MPGRHVNDQQVRLYMTARIIRAQATAAAMAGISVATGRRLERDPRPPSSRKEARDHRTRPDPLAGLWDEEIMPMLAGAPALRPITILRELARRYPERIDNGVRRTLERRIRTWRATHGPEREVIFRQVHLRLECRTVVPARSLRHHLSCSTAILATFRQKLHLTHCPDLPSHLWIRSQHRIRPRRWRAPARRRCGARNERRRGRAPKNFANTLKENRILLPIYTSSSFNPTVVKPSSDWLFPACARNKLSVKEPSVLQNRP